MWNLLRQLLAGLGLLRDEDEYLPDTEFVQQRMRKLLGVKEPR